jgi:hypothetical protein
MDRNESEDKTEAELAQEFKEYLKMIGEEISDPLREQVNKNAEYADRISSAAKKLDEELQKDIQLSVQKSLHQLNKQVITIYSSQQSNIDKKLDVINQSLHKKIESYEKKTTQRLMKHRWIETLIIFSMLTLLFLFR